MFFLILVNVPAVIPGCFKVMLIPFTVTLSSVLLPTALTGVLAPFWLSAGIATPLNVADGAGAGAGFGAGLGFGVGAGLGAGFGLGAGGVGCTLPEPAPIVPPWLTPEPPLLHAV